MVEELNPYSSPPFNEWAQRPGLDSIQLTALTAAASSWVSDALQASKAVEQLSISLLTKQQCANLRLAGARRIPHSATPIHVPMHAGVLKHLLELLDTKFESHMRTRAAAVLEMVAWIDVSSRDSLVQAGLVRSLFNMLEDGRKSSHDWFMVFQALKTLTALTYTGDLASRKVQIYKEMTDGKNSVNNMTAGIGSAD